MNGLILFLVLFHQQAVSMASVRGYVSPDEAALVGADIDYVCPGSFKYILGVTQDSDWAVVFTFRDVTLAFPNQYCGAGHPGLQCPVLYKDLVEQGSKDYGSVMPHQLPDID